MRIKMFNESIEFEEIEDTLIDIYDILGDPKKSEFKVGDKLAYVLRWELPFSISQYNGVKELDQIAKVLECVRNVKSSQNRLTGYDVEFKISNILFIRLTPISDNPSTNYKFFVKQDFRSIIFSYGEIAKFFKDRGYSIKSVDDPTDKSSETSEVIVMSNAPSEVCQELTNLINNEISLVYKDNWESNDEGGHLHAYNSIYRKVSCESGEGYIRIYPEEEKTWIEIDNNI